jgi:hypothetical protein
MSQPRPALARLSEELRNIEVFDRVYDYSTNADPTNDYLYATRQIRRKEIREEIEKLSACKPAPWSPAKLSGAIAVICTVGYALVYYSLR